MESHILLWPLDLACLYGILQGNCGEIKMGRTICNFFLWRFSGYCWFSLLFAEITEEESYVRFQEVTFFWVDDKTSRGPDQQTQLTDGDLAMCQKKMPSFLLLQESFLTPKLLVLENISQMLRTTFLFWGLIWLIAPLLLLSIIYNNLKVARLFSKSACSLLSPCLPCQWRVCFFSWKQRKLLLNCFSSQVHARRCMHVCALVLKDDLWLL